MDDRTMLMLAAKAAGIEIHDWNGDWPVYYVDRWSGNPEEPPQYEPIGWNPLADNGDAFSLAVKLRIIVDPAIFTAAARPRMAVNDVFRMEHYSDHGGDETAATRRAITRAAAAIQQSKESGDAA